MEGAIVVRRAAAWFGAVILFGSAPDLLFIISDVMDPTWKLSYFPFGGDAHLSFLAAAAVLPAVTDYHLALHRMKIDSRVPRDKAPIGIALATSVASFAFYIVMQFRRLNHLEHGERLARGFVRNVSVMSIVLLILATVVGVLLVRASAGMQEANSVSEVDASNVVTYDSGGKS